MKLSFFDNDHIIYHHKNDRLAIKCIAGATFRRRKLTTTAQHIVPPSAHSLAIPFAWIVALLAMSLVWKLEVLTRDDLKRQRNLGKMRSRLDMLLNGADKLTRHILNFMANHHSNRAINQRQLALFHRTVTD